MKRSKQTSYVGALKATLIVLLIAAIAIVALPLGTLGGRHNNAPSIASAEDKPSTATTQTVELTVNFYSTEYVVGGYPYKLHLWAYEAAGKDFDFKDETVTLRGKQWKTVTANIENVPIDSANPTANAIGVIYKHGTVDNESWGWQTTDLFIPANKIVDNKVTIYLVAGEEKIYYDVEEPDLSIKFNEAKFLYLNGKYRVSLDAGAAKFTENTLLKIKDSSGGEHGVLDCSEIPSGATVNPNVGKSSVNMDFTGEFDFGETYTVVDESTDEATRFKSATASKISLYDNDDAFGSKYNYDGKDLGVTFAADKITYKLWAPAAKSVKLNIYANGESGTAEDVIDMTRGEKGVFTADTSLEMSGKYYTYTVVVGNTTSEIVDPYARSAGRNGVRGMILDLDSTDPEGWANHSRPAARGSYSNAIIYEMHVRDMTIHESSNVSEANRGKFLGMTEKASEGNGNKKTPLDYIKDLGVTEVHILPMFDFATVNENFNVATKDGAGQYNWGYDPLNYNVPEGSYSSNPADGAVRVKELKQMIMALHEAGIRVIMDVVYNHVSNAGNSNFEKLLPGYFFRTDDAGSFTNGSGCGNDTASERYMYHKFMVDSVNYWADEYKLDGFRFDLMGLHDTLTMNEIYDTLHDKNPDIMVYGEGWKMGTMVESGNMKRADMYHAADMPNIAFFDDVTRDALRGGGFNQPVTARGYIEGAYSDPAIYIGAVGATSNYSAGYRFLDKQPFTANPMQNINYVSCHDNFTLWDKINACSKADEDAKKAMNRLAATAVLTSQGPSFFLAGEELLRSKPTTAKNDYDNSPQKYLNENYYFAENSYKSPDSVNAIDWTLAETNAEMVEFYKQLIALKKNSPQFRIPTKSVLDACLTIVDDNMSDGVTSYAVKDPNSDEYAVVLFNNTDALKAVKVPSGKYSVYVNGAEANATTAIASFDGNEFNVGAYSAVVMKANLSVADIEAWKKGGEVPSDNDGEEKSNLGLALGLGIGIPAAVLIAGGVVFGVMYNKKKGKKGKSAEKSEEPEEKPEEKAEEKVEDKSEDKPTENEEDKSEE